MAELDSGPGRLDWKVYVGDTNREAFQMTGEQAVDLTGSTIAAQARRAAKDEEVVATAIIGTSGLADGEFTVEWDGEELRALVDAVPADAWIGAWDLQITYPDGTIDTPLAGRFTVTYDVTRGAA